MSKKINILIFGNEPDLLTSLESEFQDLYQLDSASSLDDCRSRASETHFEIILIDIDKDPEQAFEICSQIKSHSPKTDIILLSKSTEQDDIVKGYKAGATDYLAQPIRIQELKEKVALVISFQGKLKASEDASRDAQQVAFSAMTDSSQLGRVLEFMDTNINCSKIEQVADSLLETCETLGLMATIYIKTTTEMVVITSGGNLKPIETNLIEKVRHTNRIIDFNQRTIYSDQDVSILIKNMPLDNPVEYGRFKDSLMTLACGANSRVRAIRNEQLLTASRDSIETALREIETNITSQTDLATNVMNEFMVDMESTILVLGLAEEQEDYILSMVDNHLKGVVQIVAGAAETQKLLRSTLSEIH